MKKNVKNNLNELINKKIAFVLTKEYVSETWNLDPNEGFKFVFETVEDFLNAYKTNLDELIQVDIYDDDEKSLINIYDNPNLEHWF